VTNSIIADNRTTGGAPGGDAPSDVDFVEGDGVNSFESGGFNVIGGGTGAGAFSASGDQTGIGAAQLNLGALADNGGPTQTVALLAGSLAVNAGQTDLTLDQRGVARPIGGAPDIGAFESAFVPPVLTDSNIGIAQDGTFTFAPASLDAVFRDDNAGERLQSVRIDSLPTNGNLSFDGVAVVAGQIVARADLGKLIFTPPAGFSGESDITFNASDGTLFAVRSASLRFIVIPPNQAPSFNVGVDQIVAENAGSQSVVNFATNISAGPPNESGQTLRFEVSNDNAALFSAPPAISADGTLFYTPAANAIGVAKVSVVLKDNGDPSNGGANTSAPQIFTITVKANPLYVGVSLTPAGPFTRDTVTATPRISDATDVSFEYEWFVNGQSVQKGAGNTLDLSKDGFGDKGDTVSVTLTARNTRGGLGSATNQVKVRNSVPFAFSGTASTKSGAPTLIPFRPFGNPGGGDSDNDALTYKRVGGPTNGVAAFETQADGSIALRYTSRVGFSGVEAIRFVAVDSSGQTSNIATLGINVTGGLPTAEDAVGQTQSGVQVDVPISGSDPNGGKVSFKRVGGPRNGTGGLVTLANGTTVMRYLPRSNFVGVEEIRFVALNSDGRPSSVATIRISVSASDASAIGASNAPSGGGS